METKDPARQLAEHLFNAAFQPASEIVASGEEHQPLLLIYGGPSLVVVSAAGQTKEMIYAAHRGIAKRAPVILIMEAWSASLATADPAATALGERILSGELRVSELPDKKEAIVFNVRIGERQFIASCPINRNAFAVGVSTLTRVELVECGGGDMDWKGAAVGNGRELDRAYS